MATLARLGEAQRAVTGGTAADGAVTAIAPLAVVVHDY
jgi:hypothetical protein